MGGYVPQEVFPLPVKDFPGSAALIRVARATWKGTFPPLRLAGGAHVFRVSACVFPGGPGLLEFPPSQESGTLLPTPTSHPLDQYGI